MTLNLEVMLNASRDVFALFFAASFVFIFFARCLFSFFFKLKCALHCNVYDGLENEKFIHVSNNEGMGACSVLYLIINVCGRCD